jgi:Protein of unknown function (DUF3363)
MASAFTVVAAKGLSDELKGTFYAVIETPTGVPYHVPLDARTADRVRVGDLVALETKPEPAVRPIDGRITDVAGRAGGPVRPEHVGSEDDARRAEQRLRALERLGLVTPAAQGI